MACRWVMTWYRQVKGHYLSQCWPRSVSPYGVTRPQWVNSPGPADISADVSMAVLDSSVLQRTSCSPVSLWIYPVKQENNAVVYESFISMYLCRIGDKNKSRLFQCYLQWEGNILTLKELRLWRQHGHLSPQREYDDIFTLNQDLSIHLLPYSPWQYWSRPWWSSLPGWLPWRYVVPSCPASGKKWFNEFNSLAQDCIPRLNTQTVFPGIGYPLQRWDGHQTVLSL